MMNVYVTKKKNLAFQTSSLIDIKTFREKKVNEISETPTNYKFRVINKWYILPLSHYAFN